MKEADPDELAEAFLGTCKKFRKLPSGREGESLFRALKEESVQRFKPLVDAVGSNNSNVWFALGWGYSEGRGVEKSKPLATYWFFKAAEAGHTDAMVQLALSLRPHGAGEAEQQEAVRWYRRAASLGNTSGMIFLGFAYREGQGVEEDYGEALRWFKAAYESGNAFAIDKVGSMYASYMDPSPEAVDYFLGISETGEAESCFFLGRLFDNSAAPFYDPEKAVAWMIKAVQRGSRSSSRALLELAYHCFKSSGTSRDLEGTRIWLDQFFLHARENTNIHNEAMRFLKKLEKFEASHETS